MSWESGVPLELAGEQDERITVSVIVPTLERNELLLEALQSVRALEADDLQLQIIVVDNVGSDVVRELAGRFRADYVTVAERGAAQARNEGLRLATGEFVAFLDDDDVWLRTHLRPHLMLMRANPDLGAVVGQVQTTDMSLEERSSPWPTKAAAPAQMFRHFLYHYPQIGATVVRREIARLVGPFDPTLVGDEDWDWHLRLASATNVGFVDSPCVLFRQPSYGTADKEWMRMPFLRRVLFRNVRAAPTSVGLWRDAVLAFVRHRGAYAGNFLRQARRDRCLGHRRQCLRNFSRAFAASPAHCVTALFGGP